MLWKQFLDSLWCNSSLCGNTLNSHLFCILQISQFISLGCVGLCFFKFCSCQFNWNHVLPSLPMISLFQLHAFKFSSFQLGTVCRQCYSCSFVDSGFGLAIFYGGMFVGLQFGGIYGFCCGWASCVGAQINCRNFVSFFSFSSSLSAIQERRTPFYQSGQYSSDTPSLDTPLPSLLGTISFHFL